MDWQGVPFPPPPRKPPRQINWPAWGCVAAAVAVWWLVYAMIWVGERMVDAVRLLGERMVDAVLAIQWPI